MMTEAPRRRALIDEKRIEFQSRDPNRVSVRRHPKFKLTYRTKSDAEKAAKLLTWLASYSPKT
jgi:hypothetical protein